LTDEGLKVADLLRERDPRMGVLVLSQYLEITTCSTIACRAPKLRQKSAQRLRIMGAGGFLGR
jgi:hypothetical protein